MESHDVRAAIRAEPRTRSVISRAPAVENDVDAKPRAGSRDAAWLFAAQSEPLAAPSSRAGSVQRTPGLPGMHARSDASRLSCSRVSRFLTTPMRHDWHAPQRAVHRSSEVILPRSRISGLAVPGSRVRPDADQRPVRIRRVRFVARLASWRLVAVGAVDVHAARCRCWMTRARPGPVGATVPCSRRCWLRRARRRVGHGRRDDARAAVRFQRRRLRGPGRRGSRGAARRGRTCGRRQRDLRRPWWAHGGRQPVVAGGRRRATVGPRGLRVGARVG